MKPRPVLMLWPLLLCFSATLFGDVVTLKDGRQISGVVQSGTTDIRIKVGDDFQTIAVDQIQSIEFGVFRTESKTLTLPAGTEIAIRTIDAIDSKSADTYREYSASLDDPVIVDGVTVIPVNAKAYLRVANVKSAGIARRASLSTYLVAVSIDGHRIDLKTTDVDSKSGSQAKRTATGAAVGAGAGAAIGAMAGGAVGAGIGAGIGAAGGTAVAVIKGKAVEIRPETRFTYKLTETVTLDDPDARPSSQSR